MSDFGISIPIGTLPAGDAIQGTIYYCAPEVLLGKPAEISNDIYSMGVVFFELLTGTVPFDGSTPDEVAMKQLKTRFPEASKAIPSLPHSIDKLIATACRKHPSERFITADAFREAILETMKDLDNFKERKVFFSKLFGFK